MYPQFKGTVLRLRKVASLSIDILSASLDGHEELNDPMVEFQHAVMERLIPPEHLPRLTPVRVERAWLQALVNLRDLDRPQGRREVDRVDLSRTKAVVATDLVGGSGIAVEIKVSHI